MLFSRNQFVDNMISGYYTETPRVEYYNFLKFAWWQYVRRIQNQDLADSLKQTKSNQQSF